MVVILREDVKELGKRGQRVRVDDGYARSVLLPNRMAVTVTDRTERSGHSKRRAAASRHPASEERLRSEAIRVFGDADVAAEWLREPIPSLDGRKPIDMVNGSTAEQERVFAILGRIDHGLF